MANDGDTVTSGVVSKLEWLRNSVSAHPEGAADSTWAWIDELSKRAKTDAAAADADPDVDVGLAVDRGRRRRLGARAQLLDHVHGVAALLGRRLDQARELALRDRVGRGQTATGQDRGRDDRDQVPRDELHGSRIGASVGRRQRA